MLSFAKTWRIRKFAGMLLIQELTFTFSCLMHQSGKCLNFFNSVFLSNYRLSTHLALDWILTGPHAAAVKMSLHQSCSHSLSQEEHVVCPLAWPLTTQSRRTRKSKRRYFSFATFVQIFLSPLSLTCLILVDTKYGHKYISKEFLQLRALSPRIFFGSYLSLSGLIFLPTGLYSVRFHTQKTSFQRCKWPWPKM